MKIILFSFWLLIATGLKATLVAWDGEGGDGMWINPLNWTGNVLPGMMDDVILDNSLVIPGYSVNLPGNNTSIVIRSLLIRPTGSTLIILIIPPANTANPALQLTGTGYTLVLNDGAILKNSSGASSGTAISINDSLQINNGGRYIHNTGRASAAIVSQLSKMAGTEYGVFEYDVPLGSYTVSLSGRTYGTLVFSATTRVTNYTGTGASPLHINGDLKINTGATFSIGMTADLIVHHKYEQSSSSHFNLQTSAASNTVRMLDGFHSAGTLGESGSGRPVLEFNGDTDQHISLTGALTDSVTVRINNPAGITLETPLPIPYNLQLVQGKIRSSLTNVFSMKDNAVYSGGSADSFVEGPMRKTGDDDFIFPIGIGKIYAPLGIANGTGASVSDEFIAEYKRGNPQTRFGINYETGSPAGIIDHISYVEYWNLGSNTGSTVSKKISLAVNCESFCRNITTLFVAWHQGISGQWKNAGQSGRAIISPSPCVSYLKGTITATAINEFSHFTLATSEVFSGNPLPVRNVNIPARPHDLPSISISPVPVSSEARITVVCVIQQYLDIQIVDMMGRIVKRKEYYVSAGNTNILFILDDLSAGPYILVILLQDGRINTTRFIKK